MHLEDALDTNAPTETLEDAPSSATATPQPTDRTAQDPKRRRNPRKRSLTPVTEDEDQALLEFGRRVGMAKKPRVKRTATKIKRSHPKKKKRTANKATPGSKKNAQRLRKAVRHLKTLPTLVETLLNKR